MTKTITRLFDNYMDAEAAIARLERLGVPQSEISVIAHNADRAHNHRIARGAEGKTTGEAAADDAAKGAAGGGALGAAGGVLAGLGLMAIPGIGPVVAAGWLASTAVGAVAGAAAGGAAGGLVGALTHAGVSKEHAHVYAESVRRGGTVVSVKVDDARAGEVERSLDQQKTVDVASRGAAYREAGWREFDETSPPYAGEELAAERARFAPR
jgi:hypothetical protein